jgi:hypothetical protein
VTCADACLSAVLRDSHAGRGRVGQRPECERHVSRRVLRPECVRAVLRSDMRGRACAASVCGSLVCGIEALRIYIALERFVRVHARTHSRITCANCCGRRQHSMHSGDARRGAVHVLARQHHRLLLRAGVMMGRGGDVVWDFFRVLAANLH